jgi:putative tricarboxylic transport membrane protein
MKVREVIPSTVWIISGVMICIGSISMRLGSLNNPGSGLFPFIIGCAMIVVSIPQVITQSFEESENVKFWQSRAGVNGVIIVLLLLSFYTMVLIHLGFSLSTFLFFVAILKTLGRKNWTYALLTALVVSFFSYMVFAVWLKINLPEGPLNIGIFGI